MTAPSKIAHILYELHPLCVICLDDGENSESCQHPATPCAQSPWNQNGLRFGHTQFGQKPIGYDTWTKYWSEFLEMKEPCSMCCNCMLPYALNFHAGPDSTCTDGGYTTPFLWLYRNRGEYQHHICQKMNGVVTSVADFDAFVFGLMDPNKPGMLNGTNIVLRDWYHSKMHMQICWPAVDTMDELELVWRICPVAVNLTKLDAGSSRKATK